MKKKIEKLEEESILYLLIILTIAVFVCFGFFYLLFQKIETEREKVVSELPGEGVFSLSATVLSVDTKNNFLVVKTAEEKEIKVILSKDTKLIRLEFPFDLQNSQEETVFTLKRTEIKISDLKEGDRVFIKALKDITGRTEFDNVDYIEVLP